VDNALQQEQAGFRPGRSCNDQIFTLSQILETVTAGRNLLVSTLLTSTKPLTLTPASSVEEEEEEEIYCA